jgi:hypothetical protein
VSQERNSGGHHHVYSQSSHHAYAYALSFHHAYAYVWKIV